MFTYVDGLLKYKDASGQWHEADVIKGESAYQAAVRLGIFSGTESEYYNKITNDRDSALSQINTKLTEVLSAIDTKKQQTLADIPDDYTTLSSDVSDLKSATGASVITGWTEGAYIKTNVSIGAKVNLTPTALAGYRYVVLDCEEGDTFTVTVAGASTPRAWAFADTDDLLLTNSNSMANPREVVLVAPTGAKKLILNDVPPDGVFSSVSYRGVPIRMRADAIENEAIQTQSAGKVVLPFKNQSLQNLTAGSLQYSAKTLATDRMHLYGEYSIDIPDEYEMYVATFWKGWDAIPETSAYSTGWKSTHIGILANPDDLYVVQIRRKDDADISLSEAENISVKKIVYDCAELVVKNWKQGTTDEEGKIQETAARVSSADALGFPYRGTFTIKLTSGYALGIRSGARSINMPTNTFWLRDGDQYTVPEGHNYFRVIVAKDRGTNNPTAPITPVEAEKIECALRYAKSPSVMAGNDSAVKTLDAASLIFNTSGANGKRAVIAHTSDVHGDIVRLTRFADFCDAYGVDYAAITGDVVAYNVEDGLAYMQDIIAGHDSQFGICLGNHDVRGVVTDADVYGYFMQPNAEKIGNTTGKNYYYKDLADQKLRMISVSLYEEGLVASTERRNAKQHMSSEQLAWLCATLKSTPAGYGIMIMMHTIQGAVPMAEGYTDFYQVPLKYASAGNTELGGAPVFDIVDAFVSRTAIDKSYAQEGTPSPISVSDDFSAVDASIEFIAFMVGHFHSDAIAYTSTTVNKLLVLNVTCANALYGGDAYPYLAEISDLHRNNKSTSQDAFNAYAIDRENKIVHVVRIGADTTYAMQKRQHMAIPYVTE